MKPMLETQHEYFDEVKNKYIVDNRNENIIANENLKNKVIELETLKNMKSNEEGYNKELSELAKEKLEKDSGTTYKDVNSYKVFKYRATNGLVAVLITALIITLCSNLYTEEKIYNVSPMLLATKNKNKSLLSKLTIAIVLPIIVYVLYLAVAYGITTMQYGVPINGNLQAYRIYDISTIIRPITISSYTILNVLVLILVFIAISVFSLLASLITESSIQSISLVLVFIGIGKVLTLVKFLPQNILTLLNSANLMDIIGRSSIVSGAYVGKIMSLDTNYLSIGIVGATIILILALNIYSFKKLLTK